MRAEQYEALGVRRLYAWVSGLVHEPLLPPTDAGPGDWTKSQLLEARLKTQYFGAANLSRAACYAPQAIAFGLFRYWPGLVYVLLIWGAHLLLVAVENYKRKLCDVWLGEAADTETAPPQPEPEYPPGIYRLRSFESERFYARLGVEWFRRFAVWMMSALTYGFTGKRMTFISQPSRKQAVAFERETRVSEAVHWCSAISVAPLVVLSWLGAPLSVAVWSTVIVIGDVMLASLQRYHRVRVWPVIQRMLERKS